MERVVLIAALKPGARDEALENRRPRLQHLGASLERVARFMKEAEVALVTVVRRSPATHRLVLGSVSARVTHESYCES